MISDTITGFLDKLENGYRFECEAGPLKNCAEWIQLRGYVSKLGGLILQGNATDHIWTMGDGKEPHTIGIRMDCGDNGTVYLTPAQANSLAEQLIECAEAVEES